MFSVRCLFFSRLVNYVESSFKVSGLAASDDSFQEAWGLLVDYLIVLRARPDASDCSVPMVFAGQRLLPVAYHLGLNSGFLSLFTIGGGPSVSGYGNLGLPLGLDSGGGRSASDIGVLGGIGGA